MVYYLNYIIQPEGMKYTTVVVSPTVRNSPLHVVQWCKCLIDVRLVFRSILINESLVLFPIKLFLAPI